MRRLIYSTLALSLTGQQTQQLQALSQAQRVAAQTSPANLMRLRADLIDARSGDTNLTAVRASLDKISAL